MNPATDTLLRRPGCEIAFIRPIASPEDIGRLYAAWAQMPTLPVIRLAVGNCTTEHVVATAQVIARATHTADLQTYFANFSLLQPNHAFAAAHMLEGGANRVAAQLHTSGDKGSTARELVLFLDDPMTLGQILREVLFDLKAEASFPDAQLGFAHPGQGTIVSYGGTYRHVVLRKIAHRLVVVEA